MYRFEHVVYLWLLVSIPILLFSLYAFIKWQRISIDKLGNRKVVMQQLITYIPNRFTIKMLLLIASLFFLIVALAVQEELLLIQPEHLLILRIQEQVK